MNVERGAKWLEKMIKASEEKRPVAGVVEEMVPPVKEKGEELEGLEDEEEVEAKAD
jgi:hypothetical protein